MEKLISLNEIRKQGYKKVRDNLYHKKPNSYYKRCLSCGSWTFTARKPIRNQIVDICFWCNTNFIVDLNKTKTKGFDKIERH